MASPRPLPKTLQDMRENELDKPCSDLDLACLACELTEWERVAPHLGISEAEADEVRHDSKSYWHQKRDVLRKWKHKQGSGATYRKIITVFCELDKQNLSEELVASSEGELDKPCSDHDLAYLANEITEWEKLAPSLSITAAEASEIHHDSATYWHQKYRALLKWKEKMGSRAAKRRLLQILWEQKEQSVAEKLVAPYDRNPVEAFRTHLKQCYQQKEPPSASQWPIAEHPVYIDPTLLLVQKGLGKFGGGMKEEDTAVELADIFKTGIPPGKAHCVLLEGHAGAGKSTLLWHASQEWAKGELFQGLDLLITISLADPAIRSASSLADLIPHVDDEIRKVVASYIGQKGGAKTGIFVDSLDLVPPQEQGHLYVLDVLRKRSLPHASILVASRPEGSKSLRRHFSNRVRVQGFTQDQMKQFFLQSHTPVIVENFFKLQAEKPAVLGLCSLPINAAIIAFLFDILGMSLPETRTELYNCLLLNLLLRHIQECTPHGHSIECLESHADLPPDVAKPFQLLCQVAYNGIIQCKSILTRRDIQAVGVNPQEVDTLGLMQQYPSLSSTGWSSQYTFLHQSVQEFLAAIHLSTLSSGEQVTAAVQLIERNPSALVLPFLTGITKNHSILQVLRDQYPWDMDVLDQFQQKLNNRAFDTTLYQSLVQLFYSMYESQVPVHCEVLANKLESLPRFSVMLPFPSSVDRSICTCIGYYLANHSTKDQGIFIDLTGCKVGDLGVALIVQQLTMSMTLTVYHNTLDIALALVGTGITGRGVKFLCLSLHVALPVVLRRLNLGSNWHPSTTDIGATLKVLIETLASYPHLKVLDLSFNNITSKHTWHLVLMLYLCPCIYLSENRIGPGIPLLAAALQFNRTKSFVLENCQVTSDRLKALGHHLKFNTTLNFLSISDNPFSSASFTTFLNMLHYNCRLELLMCSLELTQEQELIVSDINRTQTQAGLPQLNVVNNSDMDKHLEAVKACVIK